MFDLFPIKSGGLETFEPERDRLARARAFGHDGLRVSPLLGTAFMVGGAAGDLGDAGGHA